MKKQFLGNRAAGIIAVLGDLILDEYIFGVCDRISPEAPVPVVKVTNKELRLGGAANVAYNIQAFGGKVLPFAVSGSGMDTGTDRIFDKFELFGISTRGIACDNLHHVPRKVRVNVGSQNIVRYDIEKDIRTISDSALADLKGRLERHLQDCKCLLISDYNFGVVTSDVLDVAIRTANSLHIPSIVDPKGRNWEKYYGCTYITPNVRELEQWSGVKVQTFEQEQAICQRVIKELSVEAVILTKSEEGMVIHSKDGSFAHIKSKAKQVADVTGAGDTVTAFIGMGLVAGFNIAEACKIGTKAAGIAVGKIGTSIVTVEEFQDNANILTTPQAAVLAGRLRLEKQKISFTNGCFDILHAGHLYSLKEAKAQGDILIVGINSDKSVRKNKEPSRPLINQHERAQMLAHLECVDYVVIFDEDSPEELVRKIKPDVLVKGADYAGQKLAGADFAKEIYLVELQDGLSTTKIIEKAKGSIS